MPPLIPSCTMARMTTAAPTRRTRIRNRDASIVLSTPKWRDNPEFVNTAIALNTFVSCGAANCGKVIGIGVSQIDSERDARDNNTGILTDAGWRCEDHTGE